MADFDWSSLNAWVPAASGGFSALGSLFNLIQQIQRNNELAALRRAMTPDMITQRATGYFNSMLPGANYELSRLVGDAASRGWSGSPSALAGLIPAAYGPYQTRALEMSMGYGGGQQPFTTPTPGITNPFDAYLKALQAYKMSQSTPGITYSGSPAAGEGLEAVGSPGKGMFWGGGE